MPLRLEQDEGAIEHEQPVDLLPAAPVARRRLQTLQHADGDEEFFEAVPARAVLTASLLGRHVVARLVQGLEAPRHELPDRARLVRLEVEAPQSLDDGAGVDLLRFEQGGQVSQIEHAASSPLPIGEAIPAQALQMTRATAPGCR